MEYVKTDPTSLNLFRRLAELPKSAWDRVTSENVGIEKIRYRHIIHGKVQLLSEEEIKAFTTFLKCTSEQFLNPDYTFKDFRTAIERREDLCPSLEKIA